MVRRRKFDVECFTEDNLNSTVNVHNCNCTYLDYECDFNFEISHTVNHSNMTKYACIYQGKDLWQDSILEQCEELWTTQFYISSGYRKIPGDTCVNGLQMYLPQYYSCNKSTFFSIPLSDNQAQIVGGVCGAILLLIVVTVVLVVLYKRGYISFSSGFFQPKSMGYKPHVNAHEDFVDYVDRLGERKSQKDISLESDDHDDQVRLEESD